MAAKIKLKGPWIFRPNLQFVGERLGKPGAFGKVWKALHKIDKSEYAIKQISLNTTLLHFEGNVEKLLREVVHLATINFNCENIVKYHDCWVEGEYMEELMEEKPNLDELMSKLDPISPNDDVEDTFIFVQMELCHGTLEDWLEMNKTKEIRGGKVKDIADILTHLATALKSIHEQRLIHRDLKPDNIFYKEIGSEENKKVVWKIGDFGLSIRRREEPQFGTGSEFLSIKGNQPYASPEKKNKLKYDMKSDVYSLGLIFVQTLFPFENKGDRNEVFDSIGQNKEWDRVSGFIGEKYSDNLLKVVKEMLHTDPALRWEADNVWNGLREFAEGWGLMGRVDCDKRTPNRTRTINSIPTLRESDALLSFEVPCSTDTIRDFIGRRHELSQLLSAYKDKVAIVISGPVGIGKTELAKFFVHHVQKQVQRGQVMDGRIKLYCIWLQAGSPCKLRSCVIRLAKKSGVINPNSILSVEQTTIGLMLEIFEKLNDGRVLLILDGVDGIKEDMEALMSVLVKAFYKNKSSASRTGISVIITTTIQEIQDAVKFGECLPLTVLNEQEIFHFIEMNFTQDDNNYEEMIPLLSVQLRNHPILVGLALAYVKQQQTTFTQEKFTLNSYCEIFEEMLFAISDLDLREPLPSGIGVDIALPILTCTSLILKMIQSFGERGHAAVQLIHLLSYLDPLKHTTFDFLIFLLCGRQEKKRDPNASKERRKSETRIKDLLNLLATYNLLSQTPSAPDPYGNANSNKMTVSVDKYTSWAVRTIQGEEDEIKTITTLLNTYVRNDPHFYSMSGFGEENVYGHYISFCKHASRYDALVKQYPYIFQKFFSIHSETGVDALQTSNVVQTLTRILGADNIYTLNVESNWVRSTEECLLRWGLESKERIDQVINLYRDVLEKQHNKLGDAHELTQTTLSALSRLILRNYERGFSLEEGVEFMCRKKKGHFEEMKTKFNKDTDVFKEAMSFSSRNRLMQMDRVAKEKNELISNKLHHEIGDVVTYSRILMEEGKRDEALMVLEDVVPIFKHYPEPLPTFLESELRKIKGVTN